MSLPWDDARSSPLEDIRRARKRLEADSGWGVLSDPFPDWMVEKFERDGIPQHIIDSGRKPNVGTTQTECDYCNATGRVLPFHGEEHDCPRCKGAGCIFREFAHWDRKLTEQEIDSYKAYVYSKWGFR